MALLDTIKALVKGKKAAVLIGYADAVRAVARGEKAEPERVAGLIDAAGKTPDEFEHDVAAHAERVRLRAVVDKRADAEKKLTTARAKIDQLEKKLEDAVAGIRDEAAPLHEQVRKAEADLAAAHTAEDELRKTYPEGGPARQEFADAQRRERAADAKRHEIKEKIKLGNANITLIEGQPANHQPTAIEDTRKRLAAYQAELTAADAERNEAVKDMEAATARMGQAKTPPPHRRRRGPARSDRPARAG